MLRLLCVVVGLSFVVAPSGHATVKAADTKSKYRELYAAATLAGSAGNIATMSYTSTPQADERWIAAIGAAAGFVQIVGGLAGVQSSDGTVASLGILNAGIGGVSFATNVVALAITGRRRAPAVPPSWQTLALPAVGYADGGPVLGWRVGFE